MPHKAFITNKSTKTLKKRLHELIQHSQELKCLVGFFYFSGWQELYQSLKAQPGIQIKILVGLDVDRRLSQTIEVAESDENQSNDEKVDRFFESLSNALNAESMDIEEFYEQMGFFMDLIQQERLLIRKTLEPNHAKLYLFKVKDELKDLTDGRFITGSSNLTRAGILEQNEFNVEISDYGTEEAEQYFDELWETAVQITERPERRNDLMDYLRNRTQAALVTPFEAYMLVLKSYLDLMEQMILKPQIIRLLEKRGYKNYAYQSDAVNQALTILEHYHGVIIADVVGLGKSVIAGMVAKHLGKRGMILCPPGLMGDKNAKSGWQKYLHDFELYDWEIRSSGDLEKAADYVKEYGDDIEVVIVDEAHRFRNQDTQQYEHLSIICRNRQVILLSATPFNNTPADIFSLLKLFIIPGKSKITLDDNLEDRFSSHEATFQRLSYITKNHASLDPEKRHKAEAYYAELFEELPIQLSKVQQRAHYLAKQIRTILEPVMIRRNRLDLKADPTYSQEISELSEVENPQELFFELSSEQSAFYDDVVNDYFGEGGQFTGAIYQPFLYEKKKAVEAKKLDQEGNRAYQQQRNLYEFMRRLLVKRFESSFGAFAKSISNFERVHQLVLEFIEKSGGKYILDRKLIEKLVDSEDDEIETALEEFAKRLETQKLPKNDRIYQVSDFDHAEEFLADIQADLSLMGMIRERVESLNLLAVDPKAIRLVEQVKYLLSEPPATGEPTRKVIIFTEYVDTVRHLQPVLEKAFPGWMLSVGGRLSATTAERIRTNFDAGAKPKEQENTYHILLTSDKLSEGVDLNRAGAIINYDIPWNPTRVIQRVGRINRIGKKVFNQLRIYNFFPTEQGADIIKSRQIAAQKMFLIHNTLGEDSRIFDIDETPTASELYKRINTNPEEEEGASLLTTIKCAYKKLASEYPEVVKRISHFPARVKTAKRFDQNQLFVFRRKGLGFFIQCIEDTLDKAQDVQSMILEESLPRIQCGVEEPRLNLSNRFWHCYERIKNYKETINIGKSDISLETKALNNLQSALSHYKHEDEMDRMLPFIRTLIKDLRDYNTLPKYTLRRLASVDLKPGDAKAFQKFIKILDSLRGYLGVDYLDIIRARLGSMKSEVIIAIENIKDEDLLLPKIKPLETASNDLNTS